MSDVVQKFWGFCHTLRHDGIDYGDYIEQITYLLFLKMADERRIDLSHVGGTGGAGRATDCSSAPPPSSPKKGGTAALPPPPAWEDRGGGPARPPPPAPASPRSPGRPS